MAQDRGRRLYRIVQAGAYVKRWPDTENPELVRDTAQPSEISLVVALPAAWRASNSSRPTARSRRVVSPSHSTEGGKSQAQSWRRRALCAIGSRQYRQRRRSAAETIAEFFAAMERRPQRRSHPRRSRFQRCLSHTERRLCRAALQPQPAQKADQVRRAVRKVRGATRCGATSRRPNSPTDRGAGRAHHRPRTHPRAAASCRDFRRCPSRRKSEPRRSRRRTGAPFAAKGFAHPDQGRPDPAETFQLSSKPPIPNRESVSMTAQQNALELIQAIRKAQAAPLFDPRFASLEKSTFAQSASATSGLTYYDLEAGAKLLFPVLTPLRNSIPRVPARAASRPPRRAITAINPRTAHGHFRRQSPRHRRR